MKSLKLTKTRTWIRLITFAVITAFLCQNIAWAKGNNLLVQPNAKLKKVSDNKSINFLSPTSPFESPDNKVIISEETLQSSSLKDSLQKNNIVSIEVTPPEKKESEIVPKADKSEKQKTEETFLKRFKKSFFKKLPIIIVLGVSLLLRILVLDFNTAYMDEALYLVSGEEAWTEGIFQHWFSGTMLWPLISYIGYFINGLLGVRGISAILGTLTVYFVYKFTKEVIVTFKDKQQKQIDSKETDKIALISAMLFSISAAPFYISMLATHDAMAFAFLAAGVWLLLKGLRVKKFRYLITASLFLVISFLAKYVTIVLFPGILLLACFIGGEFAIVYFVLPFLILFIFTNQFFIFDVALGINVARSIEFGLVQWREALIKGILAVKTLLLLSLGFFIQKNKHPKKKYLIILLIGLSILAYHTLTHNIQSIEKHMALLAIFLAPIAGAAVYSIAKKIWSRRHVLFYWAALIFVILSFITERNTVNRYGSWINWKSGYEQIISSTHKKEKVSILSLSSEYPFRVFLHNTGINRQNYEVDEIWDFDCTRKVRSAHYDYILLDFVYPKGGVAILKEALPYYDIESIEFHRNNRFYYKELTMFFAKHLKNDPLFQSALKRYNLENITPLEYQFLTIVLKRKADIPKPEVTEVDHTEKEISKAKIPVTSPKSVTIVEQNNGFQLLVNGNPFYVRGIGYNPDRTYPEVLDRDFKNMEKMGVNTIIGWAETDFDGLALDKAHQHGISVIMPYWLDIDGDYGDSDYEEKMLLRIERYVKHYKDHPAVLMWRVGNETLADMKDVSHSKKIKFVKFIDRVAQMIHRIDPDHPVVYSNPNLHDYSLFLKYAPNLDIFGSNTYKQIHDINGQLRVMTTRLPVLFTEYGPYYEYDQFNYGVKHASAMEYENCWQVISENRGSNLGGLLFVYQYNPSNPTSKDVDFYGIYYSWGQERGEIPQKVLQYYNSYKGNHPADYSEKPKKQKGEHTKAKSKNEIYVGDDIVEAVEYSKDIKGCYFVDRHDDSGIYQAILYTPEDSDTSEEAIVFKLFDAIEVKDGLKLHLKIRGMRGGEKIRIMVYEHTNYMPPEEESQMFPKAGIKKEGQWYELDLSHLLERGIKRIAKFGIVLENQKKGIIFPTQLATEIVIEEMYFSYQEPQEIPEGKAVKGKKKSSIILKFTPVGEHMTIFWILYGLKQFLLYVGCSHVLLQSIFGLSVILLVWLIFRLKKDKINKRLLKFFNGSGDSWKKSGSLFQYFYFRAILFGLYALLFSILLSFISPFSFINTVILGTFLIYIIAHQFITAYHLSVKKEADRWKQESSTYTQKKTLFPNSSNLPSQSIIIPVYSENWEDVIKRTLDEAVAARNRYNEQAGTKKANIVVADDYLGVLYWRYKDTEDSEILAQISQREQYYKEHNIAYIARPPHGVELEWGAFERRGNFKKASNLNYLHRLADFIEQRRAKGMQSTELETAIRGYEYNGMYLYSDAVMSSPETIKIGDTILFLDKDSSVPVNCLLNAAAEFQKNPNLGFTYYSSFYNNRDESEISQMLADSDYIIWQKYFVLMAQYGMVHFLGKNGFIGKSALRESGYWSETNVAEDYAKTVEILLTKNPITGTNYRGKYINIERPSFEKLAAMSTEQLEQLSSSHKIKWEDIEYYLNLEWAELIKTVNRLGISKKQIDKYLCNKGERSSNLRQLATIIAIYREQNLAFGEGAFTSATEMIPWMQKVMYGTSEFWLNPINKWHKKGIFTKLFKSFMKDPDIPSSYKFNMLYHCFSFFFPFLAIITNLGIFGLLLGGVSLDTFNILLWVLINILSINLISFNPLFQKWKEQGKGKIPSSLNYLKRAIFFGAMFFYSVKGIFDRLFDLKPYYRATQIEQEEESLMKITSKILKTTGVILAFVFIYTALLGLSLYFHLIPLKLGIIPFLVLNFWILFTVAITPFYFNPQFKKIVSEKILKILFRKGSKSKDRKTAIEVCNNLISEVMRNIQWSKEPNYAAEEDLWLLIQARSALENGWQCKIKYKESVFPKDPSRREFVKNLLGFIVAIGIGSALIPNTGEAKPPRFSSRLKRFVNWIIKNINSSTGLPPSHVGDPYKYNMGFLYDHAIAALVLHRTGHNGYAKGIIDYYVKRYKIDMNKLKKLLDHNNVYGILRVLPDKNDKPLKGIINAVDISKNWPAGAGKEWYVDGGPQYWLAISMLQIDKDKYLKYAEELADFGLRLQVSDGGIKAGPKGQKTNKQEFDRYARIHTEHNIDAYALFKMLYRITGKKKYKKGMERVFNWLKSMYIQKDEYFFQGINEWGLNGQLATDVQAWSICAIGPEKIDKTFGEGTADKLINTLEKRCLVRLKFKRHDGKAVTVTAFDFSDPYRKDILDLRGGYKPLITPEWSAQVALAYYEMAVYSYKRGKKKLAKEYKAKGDALIENIMLMASSKDNTLLLPYATKGGIDTGFGWPTSKAYATLAGTWVALPMIKYNPFVLGGGNLAEILDKIPSLKSKDALELLDSELSPERSKNIGGKDVDHRRKINPHLEGWLKQNKDEDRVKVVDYYFDQKRNRWIPYKVEYKEEIADGTVQIGSEEYYDENGVPIDRGKELEDYRYQLSEKEQQILNAILEACGYNEVGKPVRFRLVLDEVAVAWRGDIDHSSLVHVGEHSATIWFGEGLFRDLLSRDEDPMKIKVFGHEKEHLLGNHRVDEEDEHQDLVKEVEARCTQIEERSISIEKAKKAFETLGYTAKENNELCSKWSSLNGKVQSVRNITKLKFAIPANVLRNVVDITNTLNKLKNLRETKFELIVYDIEDEKEAYIMNKGLKYALNLSSNIEITTITKDQMGSGNIGEKVETIKKMVRLGDNEYLAITTDIVSETEASILNASLESQAKDRTCIRIIQEPGNEGVISLSAILVGWLESIDDPSIKIILPTIVSVKEIRERLEAQMKYAWEILSAA